MPFGSISRTTLFVFPALRILLWSKPLSQLFSKNPPKAIASRHRNDRENRMKAAARLAFILVLTFFCAGGASAQEASASLRGTVTDGSGAVVPGAQVTAIKTETGLQRTAVSDAQGAYVLLALPVGHYRLETSAKGFKKYVQEGISLDVNQTGTVTIRLTVGISTQQIEVTVDVPIIESTSTNLGQTVGEREVLDLPLNGRHFTQLGLLQPGVVPVTPGLLEAGGTLREGQAYAVNGKRPESNNFLIDGADNFNGVDGGFVLQPPVDAIAEFKILTHTANAEFGHSTGSTTDIITRSGTNNYHGALWEFFRNNALDAKSFFPSSVEPLHRNQFGATLGGPVRKDKTFFFAYYEGIRNSQGETTLTAVPSDAERGGNFGELCANQGGSFDPSGNCVRSDGAPLPRGQLFLLFGPSPAAVPFNMQRVLNPISANLLAFYPHANQGLNTYVGTQILTSDSNQFGVRLED